jgi:uncharacterized membrane protein YccC
MTLRRTLVVLGLYEPQPPGPKTTDETRSARKERARLKCVEWRQAERLRRAGHDVPKRQRGRPRKYTREEAKEALRRQGAESRKRYKERIAAALQRLETADVKLPEQPDQQLEHDDAFGEPKNLS